MLNPVLCIYTQLCWGHYFRCSSVIVRSARVSLFLSIAQTFQTDIAFLSAAQLTMAFILLLLAFSNVVGCRGGCEQAVSVLSSIYIVGSHQLSVTTSQQPCQAVYRVASWTTFGPSFRARSLLHVWLSRRLLPKLPKSFPPPDPTNVTSQFWPEVHLLSDKLQMP